MKLFKNEILKFDRVLPIYNWYYPLRNSKASDFQKENRFSIFDRLDVSKVRSRALYFHIPFCETICTFCPFVRTPTHNYDVVEAYTQALIREIDLKASYQSVSSIPIGAIFFGGGTPSLLSVEQILRIGRTIHSHFDLRALSEFSFEFEVKSITPEKLAALSEIGVTHARFGLQTFNPRYRELFELTATLDHIQYAVETLPQFFPYTSFDILYGMNGQTEEDFFEDIQKAVATKIPNIDFYPINNVVSQPRLHRSFNKANLFPTSGLTKFYMNILLREFMHTQGYSPHNGHGYVKMPTGELKRTQVITDYYTFRYHEYVYGYNDAEIIGFGTNAISSLNGYTIINDASLNRYIDSLLQKNCWEFQVGKHSEAADGSKGVILHLPYHGCLDKSRVNWDVVYPETLESLKQIVEAGLVRETEDYYELTQEGWQWYVNLMYYLSPKDERQVIDSFISKRQSEPNRRMENSFV